MFDWTLYLYGLAVTAVLVSTTWVASTVKRDVSIVDSTWSLMFLAMAFTYTGPAWMNGELTPRALLLLLLVSAWALRLSIYISWRNWGEEPGATGGRPRIAATRQCAASTNPASP